MLRREEVVGQRIADILGDSSRSDEEFLYSDFLYVLENGIAFRMPWTEDSGDVLPAAQPTANHRALTWPRWPRSGWGHYRRNLWRTQISDILIPEDPEERYPDSGRIALTSGWYVVQLSGAPHGIAPGVDIISEVPLDGPMLSVWSASRSKPVG